MWSLALAASTVPCTDKFFRSALEIVSHSFSNGEKHRTLTNKRSHPTRKQNKKTSIDCSQHLSEIFEEDCIIRAAGSYNGKLLLWSNLYRVNSCERYLLPCTQEQKAQDTFWESTTHFSLH